MLDARNIQQTSYATILVESGLSAGIHNAGEDFDQTYDICDGVQITEIDDGGIADGDYNVSVTNNNGTPLPEIPIQSVATSKSDGTSPNERYLDILFDSKSGNKVKLNLHLPAVPGSAVKVKATFRLRRLITPVKLPNP